MKLTKFLVHIGNGGELAFKSLAHTQAFKKFTKQFAGQDVYLTINEKKPNRSTAQNNYYWAYLGMIEQQTGNTAEDLHELFKGKFLSNGIVDVFGEKVRRKTSTAILSSEKFGEYLEKIAAFTGIELPDTREYLGYSYHQM